MSSDTELASSEVAKKVADEHLIWFMDVVKFIYRTAFLHGYKHGYDKAKEEMLEH